MSAMCQMNIYGDRWGQSWPIFERDLIMWHTEIFDNFISSTQMGFPYVICFKNIQDDDIVWYFCINFTNIT